MRQKPQKDKTASEGTNVGKQLQGVTTRQPLKGRADVIPRLILQAIGDTSIAVATASPKAIASFLIAPVIDLNNSAKITQELREGWDRVIKDVDYSAVVDGAKPVIISAQKKWNLHEDEINIIEGAYILDGAKYLEYLLKNNRTEKIPLIVIFNKNESEELKIRQGISKSQTFSLSDLKNKVGSEAPRLTIDEKWRDVKIITDPFVVKTSIGYTAAINTIENKTGSINHVLVGAKSLSNELELMRQKYGSLVGIEIKIRKQSSDQKSPYEIKFK